MVKSCTDVVWGWTLKFHHAAGSYINRFVFPPFSRTPGSRQGSPSEEDLNKNGMVAGVGVGVGVKESELVGGSVVLGAPAPVLSNLDHPGFESVGGGAVGGMGGPAGMLDPSMGMGGAGGPFSSPAGADYNSMAASIPMDSPTTLLPAGHGGPQPQNFTDTQVSCISVFPLVALIMCKVSYHRHSH